MIASKNEIIEVLNILQNRQKAVFCGIYNKLDNAEQHGPEFINAISFADIVDMRQAKDTYNFLENLKEKYSK